MRSHLNQADDVHDPAIASQKHVFKTRIVNRRRSLPTLNSFGHTVDKAVDTGCDKDAGRCPTGNPQNKKQAFPTVYRIECEASENRSQGHETLLYEDDPATAIFTEGRRSAHISGRNPIYQLRDYAHQFHEAAFAILKYRQCQGQTTLLLLEKKDESMLILSDDLRQAIQKVATCSLEDFVREGTLEIPAPYQPLYFHKEQLHAYSLSANYSLQQDIESVLQYVDKNHGHEYAEAEYLRAQHQTTFRHLDKMFKPNDLVVLSDRVKGTKVKLGKVLVIESWPKVVGNFHDLNCWSWEFSDIGCKRSPQFKCCSAPVEDENEPFPFWKIGVMPLSILSKESIDHLSKRGRKCWDYRKPNFVYCTESDHVKAGRYMVDQKTHQRLHPLIPRAVVRTQNRQLDPFRLSLGFQDTPTEEEFLMMPTEIPGYHLLEKEWVNLPVSDIQPIRWNKQPFEDLVLPEETKRLVKAMVKIRASSIKTKREQEILSSDFDIIPGKGNGLVMLFHGSPGTGKTLTAESVAEIAEMPLYPITCGDIGTEADRVEEYLQLVFDLGKRWNCVLLLDEADVFLEERTLTDLQRNSLVSVFLRMLEYYEGILILTSNRVGTFDEAFRSRIQIALHYEDLKPRSRRQIWSNFLTRLEATDEGANVEDIKTRLDELAVHKLNGREIRNAVSTARQLASYEGEKMRWGHLELAIKTANNFGTYLREVHGHSDRDWTREKKNRW